MGGKSSQSTQQISIPPEVLARYNSVNAQAQKVAGTPFQTYGGEFVAMPNAQQQAGMGQTAQYAQAAQPFIGAATGQVLGAQAATQPYNTFAAQMGQASGQAVNPSDLSASAINKYMSPYLSNVAQSTEQLLNQQNQQAMAGQLGNAIQSGAFGGDRAGIAAANLAQQQQLAGANIYSNLLNQGYNTALQTAAGQQAIGLQAAQANRAAQAQAAQLMSGLGQTAYGEQMGTGQALAGLGAQAQGLGIQGAQANLAAGQVQQQANQAQDTALYNQFLQQQSYPFQVAQFLANIAEGTGALSGSTTTTTQPGGFFSDERLKENIEPVGKTFDGQTIHKYNYRGDPRKQIGLIAQEVEHHHPEAVGLAGGYKTVDYDKATSMGGHVGAKHMGEGYASGGLARAAYADGGMMQTQTQTRGYPNFNVQSTVNPMDIATLLAAQEQMYAPFSQAGLYGGPMGSQPHGGTAGYVPQASLPVGHLATAGGLAPQRSAAQQMHEMATAGSDLQSAYNQGKKLYNKYQESTLHDVTPQGTRVDVPGDSSDESPPDTNQDVPGDSPDESPPDTNQNAPENSARGGLIGRRHFEDGGSSDSDSDTPYSEEKSRTHLDIPEEKPDAKLATAGSLPQQQSGLGQLGSMSSSLSSLGNLGSQVGSGLSSLFSSGAGDAAAASAGSDAAASAVSDAAASAGSDAMDALLMAFNRGGVAGGRHGYALDGSVDDEPALPSYVDTVAPKDTGVGGGSLWEQSQGADTGLGESIIKALHTPTRADLMRQAAIERGEISANPPQSGYTRTPAELKAKRQMAIAEATKRNPDYQGASPLQVEDMLSSINVPMEGVGKDYSENFQPISAEQTQPQPTQQAQATSTQATQSGLAAAQPTGMLDRAMTNAPSKAPPGEPNKLMNFIKGAGTLSFLKDAQGNFDQSKVVPFLTGIAAMGTAPTRSFGVALSSGIGAGAQSYMNTQQQAANIAETQARTARIPLLTQTEVFHFMQSKAPANSVAVKGPGQAGQQTFTGPDGSQWHYEAQYQFMGYGKPSAGEQQATTQKKSISRGDDGNLYIGPSSFVDSDLAQKYNFDPSRPPAANIQNAVMHGHGEFAVNPAELARHKADIEGGAYTADDTARNLVQLGKSLNSLSEGTWTGIGPNPEDRTKLNNIYQFAVQLLGRNVKNDPSMRDLTDQQIIDKINTLQAPVIASRYGEKAARIAEGLKQVLPGGGITREASSNILSSMMIENQRLRDLRDYAREYVAKYGTDANMESYFNHDMADVYSNDKEAIKKLFTKQKNGKSYAEEFLSNPNANRRLLLERGYKNPDGSYSGGLGDGVTRYLN